ncbi:hypothetical protein L1987_77945 [Smallanthus sonchifolius]|uniref:Uncharacterized protein n=1 Tax=Smallanthus sonchifolius TaxID=185202 RepID=A0ACB8ZCC4_9ASTR|nr:hypothetical protein L1987_77945 [Smallanthus sonchifolius]
MESRFLFSANGVCTVTQPSHPWKDSLSNELVVVVLVSLKGIDENWAAALEHNPEAFARVVMLYVDMEVNGVPLKVTFIKNSFLNPQETGLCSSAAVKPK